MYTLIQISTGACLIPASVVNNWQTHVQFVLSKGQHIKKENKLSFFKQLSEALSGCDLEGYLVCAVLGRCFDLTYLLEHTKMNTLLHCFELNLVLTVICKAFKMKDQLPLLAFYRALIYHRQRYVARDSSKSSHERCLEELHFVI
jgi:hypothetical protein